MNNKVNFYTVIGKNAVAIFDNWNTVESHQPSFIGMQSRKFKTYNEAKYYLISEYDIKSIPLALNTIYDLDLPSLFIGVYGTNAIAIFTSFYQYEKSYPYIIKPHHREFSSLEDAEDYARLMASIAIRANSINITVVFQRKIGCILKKTYLIKRTCCRIWHFSMLRLHII